MPAFEPSVDAAERPTHALISLVVPVLNEQDSIVLFLEKIEAVFAPMPEGITYEVLFINDGSTDATENVISYIIESDDKVRLFNFSRNFGKDAALSAGLEYARGDAVIPIDVDLQDPPEIIPEMIEKWRAGAQVVNARRVDRSKDTWAKRVSANAFYKIINGLSEQPIPQNVGDYRLLDRQVVDVMRSLGERTHYNKSLFSWVGFENAEVAFSRPERVHGDTSFSFWKLWKLALDGIFSSSTLPLRIWAYLGSLISLMAFLYAGYIFVQTIFLGIETPGYASTIIFILTFGGLNLLALGIIGEYISRIYIEVRERPLYVIRSSKGADI